MPQRPKSILKPLPFPITETLGDKIARIRKSQNMTQAELAEKIGIEQVLISDYEHNKRRIYTDLLIRFSLALGVSTDELLGLTEYNRDTPQISLRLMKRLAIIDTFPESRKRHLFKLIDDNIKANDLTKQS